ncbi:MAG TPA: hypothetical protein PKA90_14765 [Ignavibacteria bacterium]|nr:hypothetical protein [Ignavibacteria bacterium]HMR41679.1 hypothetical protein [Ignavibacteria bacterium]
MRHIIRVFLPLIAIIVFVNLYFANPDGIQSIGNYPIWMLESNGIRHTNQTSGLTFIGVKDGKKIFLGVDDIGKINKLKIDESLNPPEMEIYEIPFSKEINDLLYKFKKKDMEDIVYDRNNNRLFITLEGHEYSSLDPEIYKQKEGIYELTFNKDIFTLDSMLTMKRLKLPAEIYEHTFDNVGFEGLAVTDNYFFLGLENYQTEGKSFTDSTLLYILDRKTDEVRKISTHDLRISSITALYALDDHYIYGIDRNRKSMFYIKFNDDFTVKESETREMALPIPGHKDIDRVLGIAPESITFDDNGDIYVATDPWLDFYKPDLADRRKISKEELNNFFEGVPIMYKFANEFK